MTDSEMLDWVEMHLMSLRGVSDDTKGSDVFEMRYLGPAADEMSVRGRSIRECVEAATGASK